MARCTPLRRPVGQERPRLTGLSNTLAMALVLAAGNLCVTEAAWTAAPGPGACVTPNAGVDVTGPFRAEGHAYRAAVVPVAALGDAPDAPTRSPFLLCEGERVIGHGHVPHDEIRTRGRGRFSHWRGDLYFSSSDNSNPNTNGRRYRLVRGLPLADAAMPPAPVLGVEGLPERHAADAWPATCGARTPGERLDEHAAALALTPACAATHVAARSGPWSSPTTWRGRAVPSAGARVHIPSGSHVTLDTTDGSAVLDWVRLDGRLSVRPDHDARLTLRTMVVGGEGRLELGTAAAPVHATVRVELLFAPRLSRNRTRDPFDLAGGLISQGTVQMAAVAKRPHVPTLPPRRLAHELTFTAAVSGWAAGDRVLIPGTAAWTDEDEVRTVTAVLDGGRRVRLDRPLEFDHDAPAGVTIPTGNLTRPIEVRSVAASPLAARAHVMFMHVQTGTYIDGVAFRDLGRTDTRVGHSFPALDAAGVTQSGTDVNTIGRYPVHFHVRSGARVDVAPHVVRNSVVINSPKYGIVNHGGHVIVERNVTFRVHGSHLVAENGSEIGTFAGNMAVRSNGSGDPSILSRMGLYDNAHGGNGIWLTGGGVGVRDNWASGHADSGLKMLAMAYFEQGRSVLFDGRNLGQPDYADANGMVRLMDVPVHLAGNTFVASGHGLELWNHRELDSHDEHSTVDDTTIWNVQSTAVFLPYTRHTRLSNLRIWGLPEGGGVAVDGNHATGTITIDGGRIEGLSVGIRLPQQGRNVVRRMTLANDVDVEVPPAVAPGRHIHLDRIVFAGHKGGARQTIVMGQPEIPFSGEAAVLFANDRIDLTEASGRSRRLYFPAQRPSAIPLRRIGPEPLRGLTNRQLQRRFGLAFGGAMAPEAAARLAWSNAIASTDGISRDAGSREDAAPRGVVKHELYDPHVPTGAPSFAHVTDPEWTRVRLQVTAVSGQGGAAPAAEKKFMLHPSLYPLEIHPDDVPFGYRILGYVVDRVDGRVRLVSHFEEFRNLVVGGDGFVRLYPTTSSVHGTQRSFEIALRVTKAAIRRGRNLDYFMQAQFCGTCGFEDLEALAARLLAGNPRTSPADAGAGSR